MGKYFLKDLQNLDSTDYNDIAELFKVNFPNSVGLDGLVSNYKHVGFQIFFERDAGSLTFVSLILAKRPTLYLYYVCVNPEHRGSGVFKRAFKNLRAMYLKKGFTTFALDASEEENVPPGMTQPKRIQIFNRLGFHIVAKKNPNPFSTHTQDLQTYVILNEGRGKLIGRSGNNYTVIIDGNQKIVGLADILGCVNDYASVGPDICPMQTVPVVKKGGASRRRRRVGNKTIRN